MRYWLAAILALLAGPVSAQKLLAPDEIVMYVHAGIAEQDTDFVEGLVCELGRVLVAPVRATKSDLAMAR